MEEVESKTSKDKGTNRERQRWMVSQLLVQEAKMDQIKVKEEDAYVDKVRRTASVIGPLGQS